MSRTVFSRRQFVHLAASAGLLAACNAATPVSTSTLPAVEISASDTPAPPSPTPMPPTRTPVPTATVAPTPTTDVRRPEIVQFYPTVASRVVQAQHAGVWSGDSLEAAALRQMLDASITALTGLNDAVEAWQSLFEPSERIAIKVNAFRNSRIWTHVPLVQAVTDSLQAAGVPAGQIVVFDFYTSELTEAGFAVNKDGPGVRCYGSDGSHTRGWQVLGTSTPMSDVLLACDALINIPVLKSHMLAGMSFALKNHYGTIPNPQDFHSGRWINEGMIALNLLPPIRQRTRLIIGDALAACLRYKNSYPYWSTDWKGDSILMSFDPVAHDAIGLDIFRQALTADGGNPASAVNMAMPWLENGSKMGLGTHRSDQIEFLKISL